MPMPSKTSNQNVGKFFTGENGYTIYADCHGLNRSVYSKRVNKKSHWGAVQELQYEQFGADESYDSEGEDSDEDGVGEMPQDSGEEGVQQDDEGLEVINNGAEVDAGLGEGDFDFKELYTGVQSLI